MKKLFLILFPFILVAQETDWQQLRTENVFVDGIHAKWGAWANVDYYEVEYASLNGVGYVDWTTDPGFGNTVTTTNTELEFATATGRIRYRVRAVFNGGGNSIWSYPREEQVGIQPTETRVFQQAAFSYVATASRVGPYTNEFGLTERAVTNGKPSTEEPRSIYHTKVQNTYMASDGSYDYWRGRYGPRDYYELTNFTEISAQSVSEFPYPPMGDDYISYRTSNGTLIKNVNGTDTTIFDFTTLGYNTSSQLPPGENTISDDGTQAVFHCFSNSDSDWRAVVLNLPTGTSTANATVFSNVNTGMDLGGGQIYLTPDKKFVVYQASNTAPLGNDLQVRNNDATQSDTGFGNMSDVTPTNGVGHGDVVMTIQGHAGWLGWDGGDLRLKVFEGPRAGTSYVVHNESLALQIGHLGCEYYFDRGKVTFENRQDGYAGSPDPLSAYQKKLFYMWVDEEAVFRGENPLMRVLGRLHWQGTREQAQGNSVMLQGTPDGLNFFFASDLNTTSISDPYYPIVYHVKQTVQGSNENVNPSGSVVSNEKRKTLISKMM